MSTVAALFGGQGSQYPGMGKSLYQSSEQAKRVYECAGDILGFDMAAISFEGSLEDLTSTDICQPAIFTHSLAAWETACDRLPVITAVAGHSVGEYAALCCAGAFSMEDGFRLIGARAKVMGEAARLAAGTMVAVAGSEPDVITGVCEKYERVWAVNFNLPGQTVISGAVEDCLVAAEELAALGAKTTRLSVGSAFHTPMMQPAADRLRDLIGSITYKEPSCDFYSNLPGGLLHVENYTDYFIKHMVSPVRFVDQIAAMSAAGITTCIEFGPGKTASTLAKKNNRALTTMTVDTAETLEKTLAALSGAVV